jgi:hypothetical protein
MAILNWRMNTRSTDGGVVSPLKRQIAPGETLTAQFDFAPILGSGGVVATLVSTDDEDTGYINSTTPPTGTDALVVFELVVPPEADDGEVLLGITVTDGAGSTVIGKGCLLVRAGSCV